MGLTSAQWSMGVCAIGGADRGLVTAPATASRGIAATGAGGRPCGDGGRAVAVAPASCPATVRFRPR